MEKYRWSIKSRDPLKSEPELWGFNRSLGGCLKNALDEAWVYDTIHVDSGYTAADGQFEVVEPITELYVSSDVKQGKS